MILHIGNKVRIIKDPLKASFGFQPKTGMVGVVLTPGNSVNLALVRFPYNDHNAHHIEHSMLEIV